MGEGGTGMDATAFPNDGSFLERFKQMQGGSATVSEPPSTSSSATGAQPINIILKKPSAAAVPAKPAAAAATAVVAGAATPAPCSGNGKLAFSFKPKARPAINPLRLVDNDDDEEEEDAKLERERSACKKPRFDKVEAQQSSSGPNPPPPLTDPDVVNVVDKLASFVAKTGRQFEDTIRQKNPADPRFGFLFDVHSPEYKYYEHKLAEEEAKSQEPAPVQNHRQTQNKGIQSTYQAPPAGYQTPTAALYSGAEKEAQQSQNDESDKSSSEQSDSLAMMDFYMKKAAQDDRRKPPRQATDEMPPPALLSAPTPTQAQKRGHHMGDYIPQEALEKFMAKCNDASAQKSLQEATEKAKIQADNIGHRLLSRMGWKEGEGLGTARSGRADPVNAGSVKLNNLGVGAEQPGEVSSEDDIYDQYKKRMMLGYKYRPNPLNNPRKAYY